MSATRLWSFQQAVYGHLVDHDALKGELGNPVRVYDDPPPDALFPYLVLGEVRTEAYDGIEGGMAHDLRLHAFSRYAGRREVKSILDSLYTALHDAELPIADHCLVSLRFVFADVFRRPDRTIYQGVARFRAITHPDFALPGVQ